VNYYLMDIELLFSRSPFVTDYSRQLAYVRPNRSDTVELDAGVLTSTIEIPEPLRGRNVLIEVEGAGVSASKLRLSGSLDVRLSASYGQLQVAQVANQRVLPKVYVKVYAQHDDGSVHFFKDGYTDLRGRFDYASISTDDFDRASRLALLVLSEEHGAIVLDVATPKR
jgi:hypothetical protein